MFNFLKKKKTPTPPTTMELDGIIFCWDRKPPENAEEIARNAADAYRKNLKHIAERVFEEVRDMFAVSSSDEVLVKLGRPQIRMEDGIVSYCEQTLDPFHVIDIEFADDEYHDIDYVSIDG